MTQIGLDRCRSPQTVALLPQPQRISRSSCGIFEPAHHDYIDATLTAMRKKHGYALLWDAHSIPSIVPRLFDGELSELNLGSNDGASCGAAIETAVAEIAGLSDYSCVVNDRFKGGYITRHYGSPANNIHALQLEIAQRAYMDEKSTSFDEKKAADLRDTLRRMIRTYLETANS